MIQNNVQYERIGLATEKPDILTDLPLNISGAMTGDSRMKRIPLTQSKYAIVDDEDYKVLKDYNWCAVKSKGTYYAQRYGVINGKQVCVFMHREILGLKYKDGKLTDHRNGNGLDNRRFNLRVCTAAQNVWNRRSKGKSKYRGVRKFYHRWQAKIQSCGRYTHLGMYASAKEAAKAYDKAAKEAYGEFAWTNF